MAKIGTAGNYGRSIRSDCKVTIELTKSDGLKIECPYCNKTFKEGDEIVLAVRKFVPHDEYGEVMKAKPVHRSCNRISRMRRDWRRKRLDK